MAIYHFSVQILGRNIKRNPDGTPRRGSNAVAAAAYRAGERLTDRTSGQAHDYSRRGGVVHSEILAPEGSATWLRDRERLWNNVEAMESRKDAQLAREFNMALPYELSHEQRLNLTFKIPDHMTFDEAVMVEPLTLGVHVARKVGVVPGDTAIVTGAGPIGVIIALAAVASGCSRVIITDVVQEKLDLVERAYGGRIIPSNVASGDLKWFVYDHFPYGADILFEASGAVRAISTAPDYVAPGGKIVFIGMPQGAVPINIVAVQVKEIVMYSIFRYANDYQRAINFIASGQIDVNPLIHKHYSFEQSVEAFEFAASAPPGVIKTIINVM